jgi:hypothetical protein
VINNYGYNSERPDKIGPLKLDNKYRGLNQMAF